MIGGCESMRAALLVSDSDSRLLGTIGEAHPDLLLLDATGPDLAERARAGRAALPGVPVFIRISPLAEGSDGELDAAMRARANGIWLRNAAGRRAAEQLGARIAVLEARLGIADGATGIVASVESPVGALAISSLAEAGPRLAGITWNRSALSRALGCDPNPEAEMAEPLRAVRASLLLAAAAAGVPAIDSAAAGSEDFDREASLARRDGFAAKLARDLGQLAALKRLGAQAPLGRWMENFVSGVATK
ncbi:MAG: CoA ester lyase [Enterovirga sp.]|jgi:citrate lyase subunit beta/citryl-CoA lyase|nr:CoA ester lyase [Enterovirga sp.]